VSTNFLKDILEHKAFVIDRNAEFYETLEHHIRNVGIGSYHVFEERLREGDRINLIAEIKKASPSKGMIREGFELLPIAAAYNDSDVAAISVLTEDKYFLGSPKYVAKVQENTNVPVLAKDFFIDRRQIFEARYNGASAILLIVAILEDKQFRGLLETADSLDVDCLVEVHSEDELKRALDLGAEIIGVNNRDLTTFEVDLKFSDKLIPKIPKDKVIVAESGIKTREDIKRLSDLGANAVLIGETLMREKDIKGKIKELFG